MFSWIFWFWPASIVNIIGLKIALFGLSLFVIYFALKYAFIHLRERYGLFLATVGTLVIFNVPPLWLVWFFLGPVREVKMMHIQKMARMRPVLAWDESRLLLWMERQGYQRPKDSLHVKKDLLAQKSHAALAANLEREIGSGGLLAYQDGVKMGLKASRGEPEPSAPRWESLGMVGPERMAEAEDPEDDDRPLIRASTDVVNSQVSADLFKPPRFAEWRNSDADRLYRLGYFDEVVALLRQELLEARIDNRTKRIEAIEDYLRIARTRQLSRELEKFRGEFDDASEPAFSPSPRAAFTAKEPVVHEPPPAPEIPGEPLPPNPLESDPELPPFLPTA